MGVTVCRPKGDLDAESVDLFREAAATVAGAARLVIDLSDVPFVDSSGLGAIIGVVRRIREGGGEVTIQCTRPALLRLLETTGFTNVVSVVASLDDATAALTVPAGD